MTYTGSRSREALWDRVESLCTAAIRIAAVHDLELVLQEVTDAAREIAGSRYAALGVMTRDRDGLERFLVSGVSRELFERIGTPPSGKGILGILIDDPRPLRLRHLRDHPLASGFPKHHPNMDSFLGVPIEGRSGPIGNLYLTDKQQGEEFTADDEALVVMLASHAAVAIENARLYEEREHLLQRLQRLQTSRNRFFAMINHELRNALTAVHGWTELWLRRAGADPPRAAAEAGESAERALTLLEDLLDLSRLDESKLEARPKEIDAWQPVREAIGTVEPAAERRGVPIVIQGPDGAAPAHTDPQRIRQILINLLTNAVRHGPSGEPVTVRLQVTDDRLSFSVADRGEGIPVEQQAVIFKAFERAGSDAERGTGLGLAVSRKMARLLGGDLTVQSGEGLGARFTLDLPRTIHRM